MFHLKSHFVPRSKHSNLSVNVVQDKVIACSPIYTTHTNSFCEHNIKCLNVKRGGNKSNQ